jgi:UDP-N-acetyl-2-amino-2-deoxyglucuronate dehydrogenase
MILRTIHVGLGPRGQWLLDAIARDDRFKPVALVDSHTTTARTVQYRLATEAGHKNVPVFSGPQGALAQLEADAMIIATPTKTHAEFARMAMASNQHVLVDKAMTHDYAQAQSLVADADTAWVKLCVAQDQRYTSVEQTIAYMSAKPEHPYHPGKVHLVDYIDHRYRPDPGEHDQPYAAVWDVASDHLDSLSALLGPMRRVTARSYATPWTHYVNEPNISAFIEYEAGPICNYVLTNDATLQQWRVTFQGDRGALVLTNHEKLRFYPKPHHALETSEAESVESDIMDCPSPASAIIDDFFRYVVEDLEPGISGKNNLQTLAMCEAMIRSARSKRPVEISELK